MVDMVDMRQLPLFYGMVYGENCQHYTVGKILIFLFSRPCLVHHKQYLSEIKSVMTEERLCCSEQTNCYHLLGIKDK